MDSEDDYCGEAMDLDTDYDYFDDGEDYDFVEEDPEEDAINSITSRQQQENCRVLKEADIRECQEDAISRVSTVLSVSRLDASILLRHYNWNVNQVHDQWFADEDRVRKSVGLLDKPVVNLSTKQVINCVICFEFYTHDLIASAACGHPFCKFCWRGYVKAAIEDGPRCLMLRCPDPKCRAAVGEDMIKLLASDELNNKYLCYLLRSYVENNRKIKWCPAPGCEFAVDFVAGSRNNYDVSCLCSYSFCWNCSEEAHRPVDCDTVSKWILKNNSEADNTVWILAYTKPCPKCKKPIQKNQGCNHMTCWSHCGYEFCWLCLGDYRNHDYTACNTYTQNQQKGILNEEDRRREMAKIAIDRYTHYYERWASNDKSREKAIADLDKMESQDLEKLSVAQSQPVTQLKFIIEAWLQIIECRRVLKWTYAYGYYIPQDEPTKKEFFDYVQSEANNGLERLHDCAEKELQQFYKSPSDEFDDYRKNLEEFNDFRTKLAGLTRVTKTYFENLVKALENGLEDVDTNATSSKTVANKGQGEGK